MSKTLILIDGHALAYRYFYGDSVRLGRSGVGSHGDEFCFAAGDRFLLRKRRGRRGKRVRSGGAYRHDAHNNHTGFGNRV